MVATAEEGREKEGNVSKEYYLRWWKSKQSLDLASKESGPNAKFRKTGIRVQTATRNDLSDIVQVSNSSIFPGDDLRFGGGMGSPFEDKSELESTWNESNVVRRSEVWVAELDGGIVGVVTLEDRGETLELVNIDVSLGLQGKVIGSQIVRTVEEQSRREGKRTVHLRDKS